MFLISSKLNHTHGYMRAGLRHGTPRPLTATAGRSPVLSRQELQRLVLDMVG